MNKLSVIVLTFNEEKNIKNCLDTITWADEIIVVDSFSVDKTLDIVKNYTDKIYQKEWSGYVKQRNYALSKANGDLILFLDADERISSILEKEIKSILSSKDYAAGFFIPRKNFFESHFLRFGGCYPDYQLRLFKKGKGEYQGNLVHEKLKIEGNINYLKGPILHYPYENISEFIQQINVYSGLSAQEKFKKGKSFHFIHLGLIFWTFFWRYFIKLGFLDGIPGFIWHIINSYYVWLKYVKLWELKKR